MTRSRKCPRGFTLIELMIAVAIVGILASVALPEFSKLVIRARQAERRHIVSTIKRGVEDVYLQRGALPGDLSGDCQPSCTPLTSTRRVADWSDVGWSEILRSIAGSGAPDIEGALYFSYTFEATQGDAGAPDTLVIHALGDLDGDGTPSNYWVKYERVDGVFRTRDDAAWQSPIGWINGVTDDTTF